MTFVCPDYSLHHYLKCTHLFDMRQRGRRPFAEYSLRYECNSDEGLRPLILLPLILQAKKEDLKIKFQTLLQSLSFDIDIILMCSAHRFSSFHPEI